MLRQAIYCLSKVGQSCKSTLYSWWRLCAVVAADLRPGNHAGS